MTSDTTDAPGGRPVFWGAVLAASLTVTLVLWFGRACWGGWWIFDDSVLPDTYLVSTIWERWAVKVGNGQLPLWFEEFAGGHPVHAAWMYGLFYPPLVLFMALPPEAAWTWLAILHIVFGAVGMYAFLWRERRDVFAAASGAIVFAFSGFMLGRVLCGHLNLVMPFAWIPWVLRNASRTASGERGATAWFGLSAGVALLSGHVQIAFYAAPLVAAFALFEARRAGTIRSALPRFALAAAIALGVSAIQWIPAWELFTISGHPPEIPDAVMRSSVPTSALVSEIAPRLANTADPYRHEFLGLAGPLAVAATLLAFRWNDPRRLFWMFVVLAGLLLAFGLRNELSAFANSLPPFRWGRTPGRAMLLVVVAGSVLAGHLVADWTANWRQRLRWLAPAAFLASALMFGIPAPEVVPSAFNEIDWLERTQLKERWLRVNVKFARYPYVERFGARTLRDVCPVDTPGYLALAAGRLDVLAYWFDARVMFELDLRLSPTRPPTDAELSRRLVVTEFETVGGDGSSFMGENVVAAESDTDVLARMQHGERKLWLHDGPPNWRTYGRWTLLSEKWYPGWKWRDYYGEWTDVSRANLAFAAVPARPADAVIHYRPWWKWPALTTSPTTLLVALIAALRRPRVRAPAPPTSI